MIAVYAQIVLHCIGNICLYGAMRYFIGQKGSILVYTVCCFYPAVITVSGEQWITFFFMVSLGILAMFIKLMKLCIDNKYSSCFIAFLYGIVASLYCMFDFSGVIGIVFSIVVFSILLKKWLPTLFVGIGAGVGILIEIFMGELQWIAPIEFSFERIIHKPVYELFCNKPIMIIAFISLFFVFMLLGFFGKQWKMDVLFTSLLLVYLGLPVVAEPVVSYIGIHTILIIIVIATGLEVFFSL